MRRAKDSSDLGGFVEFGRTMLLCKQRRLSSVDATVMQIRGLCLPCKARCDALRMAAIVTRWAMAQTLYRPYLFTNVDARPLCQEHDTVPLNYASRFFCKSVVLAQKFADSLLHW